MKRAIAFVIMLLSTSTAFADYRPLFRSGYWTGTVGFNGQVIDTWQVIEPLTTPSGPVPDFHRQVQLVFTHLKWALDDKAREAIAGQGTFYARSLVGPIHVEVDPPFDSVGRRNIRFRLARYLFAFDASGWRNGFNITCHVEAQVNNFSFSAVFNPQSGIESVSATYYEPDRAVDCSITGVKWLDVIGNIMVRWITPDPGDIFRTVGGLTIARDSVNVVSGLTGSPQSGQPPLHTQLQALGVAPLMGQMTTASMVLSQYIRPPSIPGNDPPPSDGMPQTWNIFSGTFATSVGQYSFDLRLTEIFDYAWYCANPNPRYCIRLD